METLWRRVVCVRFSFAPLGLSYLHQLDPRLAPWASFRRRSAAESHRDCAHHFRPNLL